MTTPEESVARPLEGAALVDRPGRIHGACLSRIGA